MVSRQKSSDLVGRGLYPLRQAARIVGVNYNTLRYWVGEAGREPLVARELKSLHLLTFAELMELHFIKMFKCENVSIQTIRKAAKTASRKFKTDHPFAVKRFDTDGKTIFATLKSKEKDTEIVEDLARGQYVFEKIIRPFFRKLDYGPVEVERFWPLQKEGRIVLDPTRRFGQPIDSETGVPIDAITDALKVGGGQEPRAVADWFEIPLEAVQAAITYDQSLAA